MNNVFNKVQILKSSENCDKFSKSVSYETLVGGTTTIGRVIKQTRRLSKGSADKPLSAVGTLTSLLCNSAKVKALSFLRLRVASGAQGISTPASCREAHKRRFLFNSWILRFANAQLRMTIPALALIFTLATTAESRADTNDINCKAGQQSCGTNCCWSVEGETLKVTGGADGSIGKINGYIRNAEEDNYFDAEGHARPWADSAGVIKNIKIEGISKIGPGAFFKMNAENVDFDNSLESIELQAFAFNNFQKLNLPDSLKAIGQQAFQYNKFTSVIIPDECAVTYRSFDDITLKEVILPYNIKGDYNYITWGAVASMREDLKIVCMGSKEDCAKVQKSLESYKGIYNSSEVFDISSKFWLANYTQCDSKMYYWNGAECLREPDVTKRKCCSSCKDMGGWCNRIRYTPAEAAEVLRDDNTNEVTITFRK